MVLNTPLHLRSVTEGGEIQFIVPEGGRGQRSLMRLRATLTWRTLRNHLGNAFLLGVVLLADPALAGPPFQADDPVPTPNRHFEVYLFANGTTNATNTSGDTGLDFNYGATPNLQLTVAIPISYEHSHDADLRSGLGNVEVAAKYRFLHQQSAGWDVAVFPRLFLPSGSNLADPKASFLLPLWAGKDIGDWSTFGGGGIQLTQGQDSRDVWIAGWVLTRKVLPELIVGGEVFHQTPDSVGGSASTTAGLGATFDASQTVHLLGYLAAGLQDPDLTGRISWYTSVLFTF